MPCLNYDEPPQRRPAHLDTITRLACEHCSFLLSIGETIPDYAKAWWEHHQGEDARRRADETRAEEARVAREDALAKLSPADRKALGL